MRRVSVIGNVGSGKSSVASALAARLRVPYIELDSLHWGPNWSPLSAEELRACVRPLVADDAWVIDGMYFRKIGGLVLERADTVVWLDLPWLPTFLRVVRRSFLRSIRRIQLWNGNRESLRQAFLSRDSVPPFAIRTRPRRRELMEEWLARPEFAHLTVLRFHSLDDALRWAERGEEAASGL